MTTMAKPNMSPRIFVKQVLSGRSGRMAMTSSIRVADRGDERFN